MIIFTIDFCSVTKFFKCFKLSQGIDSKNGKLGSSMLFKWQMRKVSQHPLRSLFNEQ